MTLRARLGAHDEANEEAHGKVDQKLKETIDPSELGMEAEFKLVYAGKEDKKGRFQWQDTIPEDVGVAVENAETAKCAVLVRKVKNHGDARKVLSIHSLVIQSPLLKELLKVVLKDYPGLMPGLNRLELSGNFAPVIHRWAKLREAIDAFDASDEEQRESRIHGELLYGILQSEFKDLIDDTQDMMSKGVMTYENLWVMFEPGHVLYARIDGQETGLKLDYTAHGEDLRGEKFLMVYCKYIEWDGTKFGLNKLGIKIFMYEGIRRITSLPIYPLQYHSEQTALRQRLLDRGAKAEGLAGTHYKAYAGMGWKKGAEPGTKDKFSIKGRVVIDAYGWNRFNPGSAVYTTAVHNNPVVALLNEWRMREGDEDPESEESDHEEEHVGDDMPESGNFAEEEQGDGRAPLTEEQKLILSPLVRGYSLQTKQWLNFFVNSVKEIEWQKDAFKSLVLPDNQKELILGFAETQRNSKAYFDDVIEGKGKGIIILLCGPPGVGKTLTAESVAEEMRAPLYMMSSGDLGLDPRSIESKLQGILEMCTKWNAILLLDEADVFLEARSLHELERNKLVTVFLRLLEYYEGIMFLTTNRVNTIDPAFQSRIHISLEYSELSIESRRTVWTNFLAASPQAHKITQRNLDSLALMNMNGRQIKNILKTAQLLASRKQATLEYEHIVTVLDVTQHLHNTNRESERTRSSLFS
ncbi:P-loop containing nucleoside triphosphate hydrolase protein [Saccharata proteae CBS 121410]|uniref:P-loop containing nucleoside triphosphate hydrolase protein n=1 Tax=Saccharata proteae CBS 121410 TaxID=1314787 RepID=A0A9P4HYC7_9PEZI|nr:P-loop containing nucleoside triphosphate hydrolase protein [Saccharata proteae CBS 121410]